MDIKKLCNKCKQEKSLSQFYKHKDRPLGVSNTCKECTKIYEKSELGRYRKRMHRIKTKEHILWDNAKNRAKNKKLEFNIEESDIIIPSICPVLGIPILRDAPKVSPNSPSLDRIDNSKGYIKGNVCIISWRANSIKKDSSIEELTKILDYMKNPPQN